MIGVDTNILIRYLVQDDEVQSLAAAKIVDGFTPEAPGFISQVVLVETVWVLTRAYKMSRDAIANIVETLLRARELVVERAEAGYLALVTYRSTKADFSDALIAQGGKLAGCRQTLTFDKRAANHAGMQLVKA